ncbi:glycoside hydrolase [Tothia fuscella]|uniref:lytic cellulose monooxygenase (C4-dehydrogenating) n=1 Tax=Tothia fuscella TaxID=1048955 RepID=A0A9P4NPN1_9PEZI|nr:glycoside hydrolase [Tothia fuscella]
MRYIFSAAAYAGLAAAHGYVKSYTVDGTTYPAFHKSLDLDPKYNVKRVDWGYAKGGPPVDNVTAPEITCRSHPLIDPALTAIARAGANITFKWSDWFTNHKGPVLTYMGEIKDGQKPEDVDFFKISEATYDPRTMRWGTDWLIEDNDNYYTSTIPSDVKPGTYIVRHELIALHNALNDDYIKKISGAQIYPQCLKVQVLGDGTATPKDTVKFPGGYKWDDKGILMNLYYGPNEYISPGPAVYKPQMASPPKGPLPVVKETGEVTGPLAAEYKQLRAKQEASFENTVHGDR